MWWQAAVDKLKGIGPVKAALLQGLGITTLGDLLSYYPRPGAYLDLSQVRTLGELRPEDGLQLCQGTIYSLRAGRSRQTAYLAATLKDETGYACLYFFGNARYQARKLQRGDRLLVSGRVKEGPNMKLLAPEQWQVLAEGEAAAPGIQPVYPLCAGLSQRELRRWMKEVLALARQELPELLPEELRQELGLLPRLAALTNIHFPASFALLQAARERLAFDEVFLLQWGLARYREQQEAQGLPVAQKAAPRLVPRLLEALPFQLTPGQAQAWQEIAGDMEASRPMRRILQGDVGSGKTVVSALALAKAVENGYQACLMAPTELLASQHYRTLQAYFAPLGVEVALLKGGLKPKLRQELLQGLAQGRTSILVGTHALLEEDVVLPKLSLAVCDEQHRFGVEQRARLLAKSPWQPDVLITTATPIPRTLALTVYGDLDISLMRGLPPGRKPVTTLCYPASKRPQVYAGLLRQLQAGRQAYVVCPLIGEEQEVGSVQAVYQDLAAHYLQGQPSALLHGRLPSKEKEAIMAAFSAGKLKVLVCTTVIEVGVDVPNASLMIIEQAEHFGLAQLHQLRGRVGRGSQQAYCALLTSSEEPAALARLGVLKTTADGFALAEEDLRLRGAGQFFGLKQHGLPDLRLVDLARDGELIAKGREAARRCRRGQGGEDLLARALDSRWGASFAAIFRA